MTQRHSARERSRLISAVVVVALLTAAVVFRAPLIMWFTGAGASETPAPSAQDASAQVDHYTCPMHPSVNQKGPGKCPICGMELVPVAKQPRARGEVTIDERRRQLIGVRTAPVVEAPMNRTFRALGRVAFDESSFTDVNLKMSGWITKLAVRETGQRVVRGQTMFWLYSPQLYTAQQDFLLAVHAARPGTSVLGGDPARSEQFGRAARKRLTLLGLTEAQVDAVAKGGEPLETIPITAPVSGFVIEKNVVEGASVEAATRLFRIAALDKVWVDADVYEQDLSYVHVGQAAQVTLDYLPANAYAAKVAYVYPSIDSAARTARVRIELANKQLELRPGMYASVELSAPLGVRVQVPTSALLYTGPRRLVFVDLGQGRFEAREVRVGGEANGMYEVLGGLRANEQVVTSGAFLIAAEARISGATALWEGDVSSATAPALRGGASTMSHGGKP
jgi:Cu(I)/Ag(I) efflux system membrane fusion protein